MAGAAEPAHAHRRNLSQPAIPDVLASVAAPASDTIYISGNDQPNEIQDHGSAANAAPEQTTSVSVEDQSTEAISARAEATGTHEPPSAEADFDVIRAAPASDLPATFEPAPLEARQNRRDSSAHGALHPHTHPTTRVSGADDDLDRLVLEKFTCFETRTVSSALEKQCSETAHGSFHSLRNCTS